MSCTNRRLPRWSPSTTMLPVPRRFYWVSRDESRCIRRRVHLASPRSWRLTTNEPTVFNTNDTELGRIPMREWRLLLERSRESWCLTPDLLLHLVSRQLYCAYNVDNLIYGVYSSAIFADNRWLVSRLSGVVPYRCSRKYVTSLIQHN